MSLRRRPVQKTARVGDGRDVVVRVGVPDDPYISKAELDSVVVELVEDGTVIATVESILSANDESAARRLAAEIVAGLESGELQPTASAIEPLADSAS
ncbi:MAG TPA: hypothetical protein VE615_04060 [Gaiellaceae bacterium]|nr:hypothetical protein [Gaiellaceae bacterium]